MAEKQDKMADKIVKDCQIVSRNLLLRNKGCTFAPEALEGPEAITKQKKIIRQWEST